MGWEKVAIFRVGTARPDPSASKTEIPFLAAVRMAIRVLTDPVSAGTEKENFRPRVCSKRSQALKTESWKPTALSARGDPMQAPTAPDVLGATSSRPIRSTCLAIFKIFGIIHSGAWMVPPPPLARRQAPLAISLSSFFPSLIMALSSSIYNFI